MTESELQAIEARYKETFPDGSWTPNREYLEASCDDIPALLAEVRRLREALDATHLAMTRIIPTGDVPMGNCVVDPETKSRAVEVVRRHVMIKHALRYFGYDCTEQKEQAE